MSMSEESRIKAAEVLKACKISTVSYLKSRAEDLENSLAKNFVAKLYSLAAHDAKQLAEVMNVLSQIDVNS